MNRSSHRRLGIRLYVSVLLRSTLRRCRDGRLFIFRQFLEQLIVRKFAQSELMLIASAHLGFLLLDFKYLRHE